MFGIIQRHFFVNTIIKIWMCLIDLPSGIHFYEGQIIRVIAINFISRSKMKTALGQYVRVSSRRFKVPVAFT
jgi:hypothetical protein